MLINSTLIPLRRPCLDKTLDGRCFHNYMFYIKLTESNKVYCINKGMRKPISFLSNVQEIICQI